MDSPKNESAREPYEAPIIEDVPIRSGEQLLAGCKLPGQGGPGFGPPGGCNLQCKRPLGS
jgi:hypothetical protein